MKNHSLQTLEHFKSWKFIAAIVITIGSGSYIYTCKYGMDWYVSVFYAILLFLGDVKQPAEIGLSNDIPYWKWIFLPAIFALVLTVSSAIKILLREDKLAKKRKKILQRGDHIIVVGLTENNKVYIDSEFTKNEEKILIIEPDSNNPFIRNYLDKSVPVIIDDLTSGSIFDKLKIEKCKHIVISVGDDMANLEIATQMFAICNEKIQNLPVYLNIEDRTLRLFHRENGLFHGMNVKLFSVFADSARELFEKYDIDGSSTNIINSDKPYGIVIVGNTKLALEVIYQACIMGQLPNKNRLTIYCIDQDVDNFKNEVEMNYPSISSIPTVELVYIASHTNSLALYKENLWHENITNVILCKENEQENLDIASNIANITYLEGLVKGTLKTKILIAMFNSYSLSNTLKQHDGIFKNFFVFGGKHDINDRKYLIDEERDTIAKAVNYVYNFAKATPTDNAINYNFIYDDFTFDSAKNENLWNALSYADKESNRSVADHIKTKLKFLELAIEKSDIKFDELWKSNSEIFAKAQHNEYLLAENEHIRWNTYHYLNGFRQTDIYPKAEKAIYKQCKMHMCLVDNYDFFKESEDDFIQMGYSKWELVKYDFLINHHIPFIMARAKLKFKATFLKNNTLE
ncbi:MAG: NAD-binding protein [Sulfurimonas sp.]|uniref:NAD-binding protein n=1 Tax=Sulfurimonas sp. TaxID=2022749 RepID=UPI003D1393F0